MEYFKLNNGISIPCIGNGPMILGYGDKRFSTRSLTGRILRKLIYRKIESYKYVKALSKSIRLGYSLIDYSTSYGDGKLIGEAIKDSGVNRNQLFLTSRISNHYQRTGEIRKCVESHLEAFGTDYLDILMFHWPLPGVYLKTWKIMERLYSEGLCKSIGVANCNVHHLEALYGVCQIPPAINQFEVHPLLTQKQLISYCKNNNILVEAYTPIARNDERIIRQPRLQSIAKKYNKTIPQIVLKWHIMNGIVPVIRSLNINHLRQNIDLFDFELDHEELSYIDSLNINSRLRFDPDNCDYSIL